MQKTKSKKQKSDHITKTFLEIRRCLIFEVNLGDATNQNILLLSVFLVNLVRSIIHLLISHKNKNINSLIRHN